MYHTPMLVTLYFVIEKYAGAAISKLVGFDYLKGRNHMTRDARQNRIELDGH